MGATVPTRNLILAVFREQVTHWWAPLGHPKAPPVLLAACSWWSRDKASMGGWGAGRGGRQGPERGVVLPACSGFLAALLGLKKHRFPELPPPGPRQHGASPLGDASATWASGPHASPAWACSCWSGPAALLTSPLSPWTGGPSRLQAPLSTKQTASRRPPGVPGRVATPSSTCCQATVTSPQDGRKWLSLLPGPCAPSAPLSTLSPQSGGQRPGASVHICCRPQELGPSITISTQLVQVATLPLQLMRRNVLCRHSWQ